MITPQRLQELRDRGILNELYQSGMITPKPFIALEVALKVAALTKLKHTHGKAVRLVATQLRLHTKTVYAHHKLFDK
jgi:hypothetical protein